MLVTAIVLVVDEAVARLPVTLLIEHIRNLGKLRDDKTDKKTRLGMVGVAHDHIAVEAVHGDGEQLAAGDVDELRGFLHIVQGKDDVMRKAGPRNSRVIYMSPQGKPFTQAEARRLVADYDHLVLVCGHYEGIDERFIEECVDEEISIGDFVLTGGELPAMVVADAVARLVPGVLSDPECFQNESHWNGLLEYPQYSRPEDWHGRKVPAILRSGDHKKIARWRRKQAILRTRQRRPDLYANLDLSSKEDQAILRELDEEPLP